MSARNPDLCRYAEACGAHAVRVRSPQSLKEAVIQALSAGRRPGAEEYPVSPPPRGAGGGEGGGWLSPRVDGRREDQVPGVGAGGGRVSRRGRDLTHLSRRQRRSLARRGLCQGFWAAARPPAVRQPASGRVGAGPLAIKNYPARPGEFRWFVLRFGLRVAGRLRRSGHSPFHPLRHRRPCDLRSDPVLRLSHRFELSPAGPFSQRGGPDPSPQEIRTQIAATMPRPPRVPVQEGFAPASIGRAQVRSSSDRRKAGTNLHQREARRRSPARGAGRRPKRRRRRQGLRIIPGFGPRSGSRIFRAPKGLDTKPAAGVPAAPRAPRVMKDAELGASRVESFWLNLPGPW